MGNDSLVILEDTILIHYGSNIYDPIKSTLIRNTYKPTKPYGGLWTSPITSEFGWYHWSRMHNFKVSDMNFKLKFHDWAKIYFIHEKEDLINLPVIEDDLIMKSVDFEKMATMYDAIWLTVNGEEKTRNSYPINFEGWDCETVFIMNPKSVYQI